LWPGRFPGDVGEGNHAVTVANFNYLECARICNLFTFERTNVPRKSRKRKAAHPFNKVKHVH